ncbi:MAG: phospholipase D-like domain-containing protein [Elusimicrobia bacterium]|nr:phospholipase D-like domain-containing protein [Elusimicrobiota bacterium]
MKLSKIVRLLPAVFCLLFSLYIKGENTINGKIVVPVVNRAYLKECLEIINSSKSSISIAHYYFKNDSTTLKIKNAIRDAAKRGIKVRVLLDGSIKENAGALDDFSSFGVKIKLGNPKRKLHAKLIIADAAVTLLGSTNFSEKSIDENNETNVLINDASVSKIYQEYFEMLWKNEVFNKNINFLEIGSEFIAVPVFDKNYFDYALELISNSKKNVGVILYMANFMPKYYSSKPNRLLRALCDAKRRGVSVRVILEKSGHDEKLNEMNAGTFKYLSGNNIEIKFVPSDIITHAKLLICDKKVILGSTNWVISGLGKNREANVLIRNDESADIFWKYFEDLWIGKQS